MAQPATGRGSDYGEGSKNKRTPAPQPTKRASMSASTNRPKEYQPRKMGR